MITRESNSVRPSITATGTLRIGDTPRSESLAGIGRGVDSLDHLAHLGGDDADAADERRRGRTVELHAAIVHNADTVDRCRCF